MSSVSSSRVFVGRERELARLTAAVGDATAGGGRLFLLGGEPGIGKTRLAEQVARYATDSGARVLWGNCWEGDGAPPYWPWVQMVRTYARDCDSAALGSQLGEAVRDMAQILPELRAGRPEETPAPLALGDSEAARFRLFDAMTAFLRRASASTPMVLVIDDLQWADQPSLLLLQFVAAGLRDSHLLLLCLYRDVEARRTKRVNDALAALAHHAQQVTLGGLTLAEVNLLIEDAFVQGPDAATAEAVHRRTRGNPFFVDEVLRLLSTEGGLALPTAGALVRLGVPEGVREVIRRRLGLVADECRELLNVASVLGRDFDVAPLQLIVQATAEGVLRRLSEARAIGIVVEGRANLARFSFSHDLVREALYEGIGYERRIVLHRMCGEALERLYGDHPEAHLSELAHHFFVSALGGDVDKAIAYCTRAGDYAVTQTAYEHAAEQYERALEALGLKGESDPRLECELLLKLGEARWGSAAFDKAREACLNGGKIAERIEAAPELARAALAFAGPYPVFEVGFVDEVLVGLLEKALALLGQRENAAAAKVMARLAAALTYSNQQERKATLARDAVAMARRLGDKSTLAYVLIMTHWATWSPDNLDERLAVTAEVTRLGEESSEGRVAAEGYSWRIAHCLEKGVVEEADDAQQALSQLTERLRQPFPRWVASVARAMRTFMEGRVDEAEALADRALSLGHESQSQVASQTFGRQLLPIRREQGRLQEIVELVEGFVERYPSFPIWRTMLAMIYAELGREREARQQLDRLAANDFAGYPRDIFWMDGATFLAEVAASVGDSPRSAVLYRLLLPFGDRCVTCNLVNCGGSVARYLGLLATTLGRLEDAERHFEQALQVNSRIRAWSRLAHTQYDYARMLLKRGANGDRQKAQSLLDETIATATQLGMTMLVVRAARSQSETTTTVQDSRVEQRNTFQREGDYWYLVYQGKAIRVRDMKGLQAIAQLLRHPGQELHVADLANLGRDEHFAIDGNAGPVLDEQARVNYKARLSSLRSDLEEAKELNDLGRCERLQKEIDFLEHELSAAFGLGGRVRSTVDLNERIRKTITSRIRDSLAKIEAQHRELAVHLQRSIRTGTLCSYRPERPGEWKL